jgi:ATP-dependent protease ClpP protease subunit
MGSIVLQAASDGRRFAFPHSWIMIHEPAKWAGWQSTTAAAQHLERLKQMQDQIYRILSSRSGKPLRQIIKDTKRTDFYLDAQKALDYGLIDAVVAGELPEPKGVDLKEPEPASPTGPRIVESDIAAARAPEVEKAGGTGKAG